MIKNQKCNATFEKQADVPVFIHVKELNRLEYTQIVLLAVDIHILVKIFYAF